MSKELDRTIKQNVPSVPRALAALVSMEHELAATKTYDGIRKIIREASALKVLLGHVNEVKAQAEDTILIGNRRIGEEIKKVPKASGGDRKSNLPRVGNLKGGREKIGVAHTSRSRLQKLADVPVAKLKIVSKELRAAGKDATVNAVVREITQGDKKERRNTRERELGAKIKALPDRRYGVILADPPWKFEVYSKDTGMDRAAGNHYPTMDVEAIKALKVPAANDCVLFLWATVPMLPQAFDVMLAWGFEYRSQFVWVKDKTGTGFWNLNQHEVLMIGVCGNVPAPAAGERYSSIVHAPRGTHSTKPFAFHEMIETMFPNLPRVELFARERFDGWDAWGNELSEAAE